MSFLTLTWCPIRELNFVRSYVFATVLPSFALERACTAGCACCVTLGLPCDVGDGHCVGRARCWSVTSPICLSSCLGRQTGNAQIIYLNKAWGGDERLKEMRIHRGQQKWDDTDCGRWIWEPGCLSVLARRSPFVPRARLTHRLPPLCPIRITVLDANTRPRFFFSTCTLLP